MMQSDTFTSIMQGDAFTQKIEILKDDEIVTPDDVVDVEVTFGRLSKTYSSGELKYLDGKWEFRLSQAETFRFRETYQKVQVRVCWANGDVEGAELGEVYVSESMSRRVLGEDADE